MTRDSRCHELPREQKLDNGRLTTKMAETCFVKLPTLDDNLRKQPNVTDLLTYLLTYKSMALQGKSLETLPAKIKIKATFFRLSHDVVTCDVDRDVSTAYC